MDRKILTAFYIMLLSLGLAIVFNFLFFDKALGISVVMFTLLLIGTVYLFAWNQKLPMKETWWLVLLIIFFALMPSIRANEFLTFLNMYATFNLLLLLAHHLVETPAFVMKIRDYLLLVILVPFRMVSRASSTVSLAGQVHSTVQHRDVWLRIGKGILMAMPILLVFGMLFSQADLAFAQFMKGFFDITIPERTAQYLALLLFAFIAALSFLSYIFLPKKSKSGALSPQSDAALQSGQKTEVLVFLGLIATLFIVFIGFQMTYLFGGETNIINAGFTYAEYARRGFWELLAVAILSLVVLLASEKYAGAEAKKERQFLIPALILIAEVIVVIIAAFKRLSLYIDAYGLTTLRFYVAGFILLVLALFVLLAVKFIKAKPEQFFAFGTLLAIATFLIGINIVNPDAFIMKANIDQYIRTGKLDVSYLNELSVDAEPWKIELYKNLVGEDKEALRALLEREKNMLQESSGQWQAANVSRTRALKLLEAMEEKN